MLCIIRSSQAATDLCMTNTYYSDSIFILDSEPKKEAIAFTKIIFVCRA